MKNIKRIVVLFIIILFAMFIKNYSYAATYFKVLNGAPRMNFIINEKNFDDVKIIIEDYSGLDASKINFYKAKNGSKGEKITDKNFIKKIEPTYTSNKKTIFKYTYTISNKYLNKRTNYFYVSVVDEFNSNCTLNTFFGIRSDGKKYIAENAPVVSDWKINNDKVSFIAKDWNGIKYVRLYDLNSQNPTKVVFQKTNLAKGSSTITFSLKDFSPNMDKYNIKIVTQDINKTNVQTAIRVISFKVDTISKELNITNIDTGVQGDCVLLESKGNNLLMDTGLGWNTSFERNFKGVTENKNKVIQELKKRNIKQLDIYLSHWHQDHYGMIENILRDNYFSISKIYLPELTYMNNWMVGLNKNVSYSKLYDNKGNKINSQEKITYNYYANANKVYKNIQTIAKNKKIKIVNLKCGSKFNVGDANINIIGPLNKNTIKKTASYVNNYSLVAMCTIGKTKFLTAGDIESITENDLLDNNVNVSADIMKLSHHGNDTSNTPRFIKKVNPKYAFYAREDTTYTSGYMTLSPINNSISNFSLLKTNMYGRASNGNITFSIKNDIITANPEKNYYTIRIKYIDSKSNKVLSSKDYKFHITTHDYTGKNYFTKYYLYDYKKSFFGYKYDIEKNKNFKVTDSALNRGQVKELKLYYIHE